MFGYLTFWYYMVKAKVELWLILSLIDLEIVRAQILELELYFGEFGSRI